jgi:hypothetical protein
VGQGCFTKLALGKKDQLYELETNVKKNREALFGIYQRCMDQSWVDFFEINSSNLINGSRHLWQPPFFKDAFINDVGNSFALIFHPPFSLKSTVELYGASSNSILPMLDDLLKILINRGVSLMQISLFNPSINEYYSWLEEKGMQTFQFLCMGKAL